MGQEFCPMMEVLVSLGYYDRIHRLSGLNNIHLFLTVLETKKSRVKALIDLPSGETLFQVVDCQLLILSSYGIRDEVAL